MPNVWTIFAGFGAGLDPAAGLVQGGIIAGITVASCVQVNTVIIPINWNKNHLNNVLCYFVSQKVYNVGLNLNLF